MTYPAGGHVTSPLRASVVGILAGCAFCVSSLLPIGTAGRLAAKLAILLLTARFVLGRDLEAFEANPLGLADLPSVGIKLAWGCAGFFVGSVAILVITGKFRSEAFWISVLLGAVTALLGTVGSVKQRHGR